jgi:hypothetical protein
VKAPAARQPSTLAFCALLAAASVVARILLVDHNFFRLVQIPSHDLSEGLAFFTTSMHSLRLEGDLAWWNPSSHTGYAQYFQAFASPLAPSWGHIVFIAWSHLVVVLASIGIVIPEYVQYLVVNYVVLPFLAFLAFAWFCSLVLRTRAAVALALVVYVLSGIGLWNSAWFYFQEPFSFFFLLGATIAFLQRPTPPRGLVCLAAALVQLASLNYWTVYNLFFFAIVAGTYAAAHRNQVARAGVRLRAWRAARPRAFGLAAAAFSLVLIAWAALILAVMLEQSGSYVRWVYTMDDAVQRIVEMRRYTTELFNPSLERALERYPILNQMHNARYLGIALLPLIVIGILSKPSRRARWLLAASALTFVVCLGVPFLVLAWKAIPFMDRIQHLFYVYSHYWQLLLAMLAAVGLDAILHAPSSATRRMALWVVGLCVAGSAATLAILGILSARFPTRDVDLEANLHAALVLGLVTAILFRALRTPNRSEMRWAVAVLFIVMVSDLAWYFHHASRVDMAFTMQRWGESVRLSPEQQRAMGAAWGAPDPARGFRAGLDDYMPIKNDFWPVNQFMVPRWMNLGMVPVIDKYVRSNPPILFYRDAVAADAEILAPGNFDPAVLDRRLHLSGVPPTGAAGSPPVSEGFSYRWTQWLYNEFRLAVTAPSDGWLMIRQLYDPAWRVSVDGRDVRPSQANRIDMAIPIAKGEHDVRWEYRPLSRRLYWPVAILLEAIVAVFLTLAWARR